MRISSSSASANKEAMRMEVNIKSYLQNKDIVNSTSPYSKNTVSKK